MKNANDRIAMQMFLNVERFKTANNDVKIAALTCVAESERVIEYVEKGYGTPDSFGYGEHLTQALADRRFAIELLKQSLSMARSFVVDVDDVESDLVKHVNEAESLLGLPPSKS